MKDINGDVYITEKLNETYKAFNNIQFENPRLYNINIDNNDAVHAMIHIISLNFIFFIVISSVNK